MSFLVVYAVMGAWVMIFIYGLIMAVRPVRQRLPPDFDVVAEAEKVASRRWRRHKVS